MSDSNEIVIEASRKWSIGWKELWQYRELFYFFTWRDVKVKYKQTWLGIFWVVLQPLITVIIFSVFFGKTLNIQSNDLPYPVFVFSGLILWNMFSSSVNSGGNSMLTHAPIIKKIYFPRLIIPISSILVSTIDFAVSFVAFAGVMIYYNVYPDPLLALLLWPLSFLLMLLATLGLTCWLAALIVKYRDFRFVIPFGLQIVLFITPIIYPISILNNALLKIVLTFNPIYAPITLFRIPLTNTSIEFTPLLFSIASNFVILILGIVYFRKTEAYFSDIS